MYVILGASGNTGRVAATTLLENGANVRVVGRSAQRLKTLTTKGAEAFAADVTDSAALTQAFTGARAVYAMVPPDIANPDVLAHYRRVSDSITAAVKAAGVKHVVSLSSIGAEKADKTGPILGLHYLEQQLNEIDGLNVLHLRAGYFMENTLGQIGPIQQLGIAVGPVDAELKLPLIATSDIGVAAANALLKLDFSGKQVRELQGQRDINYNEVAGIIGNAIGKSDLHYLRAPDAQVRPALLQMGMSASMADLLLELSASLNTGYIRFLEPRSAQTTTPTSYETFVKTEFVPLFQGKQAVA